jgi:hypothetical protein
MFSTKKFPYQMVMVCFLVGSCAHHLEAEKNSIRTDSHIQKDKSTQEKVVVQDQPRISFDLKNYDAGEVWEGEEVSHIYTFKNTGTAQLNIEKVRTG